MKPGLQGSKCQFIMKNNSFKNILGGREKIDRIRYKQVQDRQNIDIRQIEERYQIDRRQILDRQKIDIRQIEDRYQIDRRQILDR